MIVEGVHEITAGGRARHFSLHHHCDIGVPLEAESRWVRASSSATAAQLPERQCGGCVDI